jgi:hypothetical protein
MTCGDEAFDQLALDHVRGKNLGLDLDEVYGADQDERVGLAEILKRARRLPSQCCGALAA